MSDQQILDAIDFLHANHGRGGYEIILSPRLWLYDNDLILTSFGGEYVNPLGPFHKWLNLHATVQSAKNKYKLVYHVEFWKSLKEQECIDQYLVPFISMLRNFVMGRIDKSTIGDCHQGFAASVVNQTLSEFEDFSYRLNFLKKQ